MSRILIGNRLVEICGKPGRVGRGIGLPLWPPAAPGGAAGSALHALSACSACAGDYEDPDRTARTADCDDADEVEELDDLGISRDGHSSESRKDGPLTPEEFPARET
jgi:hypothetical protein